MSTAKMVAPVLYIPGFIFDPTAMFDRLWSELPWERRADAPRRECWMNDFTRPYTYGRGAGERTYSAVPWHDVPLSIMATLNRTECIGLNACFINGYEGSRDHLGWHADDSPEIDPTCPIAVVSFGAQREIWFRPIGGGDTEKQLLESGSLLVMAAGMQQTHQHRIPKHPAECAPRISLTYRGLLAA